MLEVAQPPQLCRMPLDSRFGEPCEYLRATPKIGSTHDLKSGVFSPEIRSLYLYTPAFEKTSGRLSRQKKLFDRSAFTVTHERDRFLHGRLVRQPLLQSFDEIFQLDRFRDVLVHARCQTAFPRLRHASAVMATIATPCLPPVSRRRVSRAAA